MSALVRAIRKLAVDGDDELALFPGGSGHHLDSNKASQQEIAACALNLADGLLTTVDRRTCVVLALPHGAEFVAALLACFAADVVAVPATPRGWPAEQTDVDETWAIYRMCRAMGRPAVVVCGPEIHSELSKSVDAVKDDLRPLRSLLVEDKQSKALLRVSESAIAVLLRTSGSEGQPKGVPLSHKNILLQMQAGQSQWSVSPGKRPLSWLSPTHNFGLHFGALVPFFSVAPCRLMSPLAFSMRPSLWVQAIKDHCATHLALPNFAFDLCCETIDVTLESDSAFDSVEHVFCGGEPVQSSAAKRFFDTFAQLGARRETLQPHYGMTECGAIATLPAGRSPFISLESRELNIGRAVPAIEKTKGSVLASVGLTQRDAEITIWDHNQNKPCADGETGEILVSSGAVMAEYWCEGTSNDADSFIKLPDAENRSFRTGDIGFLFDGHLHVTGRNKDIIIQDGKNHFAATIENTVIGSLKGQVTATCAVFSVPSGSCEPVILVLGTDVSSDIDNVAKGLTDTARKAVSEAHGVKVDSVVVVDRETVFGPNISKLKRGPLRAAYSDGTLPIVWSDAPLSRPETNLNPPADVLSPTISILRDKIFRIVLGDAADDLSEDTGFGVVGMTSLECARIAGAIEDTFDKNFSPSLLYVHSTLRQVAHYLAPEGEPFHSDPAYLQKNSPSEIGEDAVAIVGLHCDIPGAGPGVDAFWDLLSRGNIGVGSIADQRPDLWETLKNFAPLPASDIPQYAGLLSEIDHFDADFFGISRREAECMDPQQRKVLQFIWDLAEVSGQKPSLWDGEYIGLYVGAHSKDYADLLASRPDIMALSGSYIDSGTHLSMIANRASRWFNFKGPSEVINTACSSSLVALHHAARAVQAGDCSSALVIGVNLISGPVTFLSCAQAGMLSHLGACRTLDASADGFVRSEALAGVILKPMKTALADGDTIHGLVRTSGINHDGRSNSLRSPNGAAQRELIQLLYEKSNLDPASVSFVELHGTGTVVGDPIEAHALSDAFNEINPNTTKSSCAIGSVKAHIGHTEAAAGLVGVIKVLLCMRHKTLIKSPNFEKLNPTIDLERSPFYIIRENEAWKTTALQSSLRAGVSSFGFGGVNAHAVLEAHESATPVAKTSADANSSSAHLLVLSARTDGDLTERVRQLLTWLNGPNGSRCTLPALAKALQLGREEMAYRFGLVADSIEDARRTLELYLEGGSQSTDLVRGTYAVQPKALCGLSSDENFSELIQTWITEGNLKPVLELWVQGLAVDWGAFWHDETVPQLSLPGYPFAKESIWLPVPTLGDTPNSAHAADHVQPEKNTLTPISKPSDIDAQVLKEIGAILKADTDKISLQAPFAEIGLDSIGIMTLSSRLSEVLGWDINATVFYEHPTTKDLLDHVRRMKQTSTKSLQTTAFEDSGNRLVTTPKSDALQSRSIAIIGISGAFPQSPDISAFWQNISSARDCITTIPAERWGEEAHGGLSHAGILEDIDLFDPLFFNISPREALSMDPQQRLMLMHSWRALEDAGIAPKSLAGSNTAVIIGSERSGYAELLTASGYPIESYSAIGMVASMGPNRVSHILDLHGPSEPIETACSSSLVAIQKAVELLREGRCDLALAGGVNTIVSRELHRGFEKAGMLSQDGRCKTFSAEANGYVRGEGVGILVLKPLDQAKADGDPIYATIEGVAVNHGGKSASITAPNPQAQCDLINDAIADAQWDPRSVSYVELHGTGTALGDPIEFQGLNTSYGRHFKGSSESCGLGSVKTNIGHLELAAGVAGVIKVLLQMRHKMLVPSLRCTPTNPHIDLDGSPFYVVDSPRSWEPSSNANYPLRAGVSSFGAGGVNAHVVLQDYPDATTSEVVSSSTELIVLSARSKERLDIEVQSLSNWLSQNDNIDICALAYSLQVGRDHNKIRLAIIARSIAELQIRLKQFLAEGAEHAEIFFSAIEENQTATLVETEDCELEAVLSSAAKGWISGLDLEGFGLRSEAPRKRLHLPPSPFILQKFWPEFQRNTQEDHSAAPNTSLVLKALEWEPTELNVPNDPLPAMSRKVVLLGLGSRPEFQISSTPDVFVLDLQDEDIGLMFTRAIQELTKLIQNGFDQKEESRSLLQIVVPASGEKRLLAAVSGWLKALLQERPGTFGQVIYIDPDDAESLDQYLKEAATTPDEFYWRWDRDIAKTLKWKDIPQIECTPARWSEDGTYLITGGLGGLGQAIASDMLSQAPNINVILVGRSQLSAQMSDRLQRLREENSSENPRKIEYHVVDITDREALDHFIRILIDRFGGLTGIIHTAGVIRDSLIGKKTAEDIQAVLESKVAGTRNLDAATQDIQLELFVCFSSLVAIFGNRGQTDYAAANAFLDNFAVYRQALCAQGLRTGHTISINWPIWRDGGMQIDSQTLRAIFEQTGLVPMPTFSGLKALKAALATGQSQILVAHGDAHRIEKLLSGSPTSSAKSTDERITALNQAVEPSTYLASILAKGLNIPLSDLDLDERLDAYGLDSLMIMQLTDELELVLGTLPKTLFYEHNSLRAVISSLLDKHGEALQGAGSSSTASSSVPDRKFMSQQIEHESAPQMPVAIVGLAGTYPGAKSLDAFWENIKNGVDCITEIPKSRWDLTNFYDSDRTAKGKSYSKWGGFLDNYDHFDPLFFNISPRDARLMDPQERLFLQCVDSAIEDAGYVPAALAGDERRSAVGVFVGAMYSEYQLFGAQEQDKGHGIALNGILASIANRVSYCFDFTGPSVTVDTMCSSSLAAVHMACRALEQGECTVAVAGGVNLSLHPNKYLGLAQGNFLSTTGRCKSFGADGDGYVPAEGVGAVILKPLEQAIKDGDSIYAIIRGSALNNGGRTNGYSVPSPNAQAEVIRTALDQGGVDPATVSYVEAHGTGTALGDPIEVNGLMQVYGKKNRDQCTIALGSIKSNIGHCEAAAGIASLTKVILQLRNRQIAPSLHADELNPNIDFNSGPFQVQRQLSIWERDGAKSPLKAGISSFGAGGTNVHVVVEEFPATSREPSIKENKDLQVFVLSAQTPEALKARASDLLMWLKHSTVTLADIAFTLQTGRRAMRLRLAWVSASREDLIETLSAICSGVPTPGVVYSGEASSGQVFSPDLAAASNQHSALNEQLERQRFAKPLAAWVKGAELDWDVLHANYKPQRVHLPTYRFSQKRFWVPLPWKGNSEIKPDPLETSDHLAAAIVEAIAAVTEIPQASIRLNTSFRDYGVDSVHALELNSILHETLNVELDPSAPFEYPTVAALSAHICDLQLGASQQNLPEASSYDQNQTHMGLCQIHDTGPNGCPISLFYSTRTAAQTITIGGFSFDAAMNAEAEDANFRGLVVISHGFGGTGFSHHALAHHLVSEGYLVATPHHTTDGPCLEGVQMSPKDLNLRTRQLNNAIDLVKRHPDWGPLLKDRPTIAIGHSGGGATILSLLGAKMEGRKDLQSSQEIGLSAAVLMAPMAIPFSADSLSKINIPLYVLTAELDEYIDDPRSQGFYIDHLPLSRQRNIMGAGHFSFMSLPLTEPEEMMKQEFPLKDPEGFNRTLFEAAHHSDISDFIASQCATDAPAKSRASQEIMPLDNAVVFPGQGSQTVGMGAALFDNNQEFISLEQEIDALLGFSVRKLCQNGPKKTLNQTKYTQPSLYLVNALYYSEYLRTSTTPTHLAGHSLGEYNALLAAGVFDLFTGLKIVKARADAMSKAKNGAMAAVLGLDADKVAQTLNLYHSDIDVANFNAPTQTVISGPRASILNAKDTFMQQGAKHYLVLPVSAAFHSRYMERAAREFADQIVNIDLSRPRFTVIANATSEAYPHESDKIRELLIKQISSPVLWTKTISKLASSGINDIVEVGHSNTLTRLIGEIQGRY